jgi:hypothetical protein
MSKDAQEPKLPEFFAELEYNAPDWDVFVCVYRRRNEDTPELVHREQLPQQITTAQFEIGERLFRAVETLSLQAGEDATEIVNWLCDQHGMLKLFEKYFSQDTTSLAQPVQKPLEQSASEEDMAVYRSIAENYRKSKGSEIMSKDTPAFPVPGLQDHSEFNGMTLRQYAAIKLKVPDTGLDWLDAMIVQSLRDDFAIAASEDEVADYLPKTVGQAALYPNRTREWASYQHAYAMLKAREEK